MRDARSALPDHCCHSNYDTGGEPIVEWELFLGRCDLSETGCCKNDDNKLACLAGKAYKCCDKRPSGAEPFIYHVKKDTTEDKWVLEGSSTSALRVDDTRYNVLKCEDGDTSNCRGSLALTINTRFLRGRPGNYNSDGDSGFDGVTSDTYYALALRPTAIYNEVDDGVVRPRRLPGIFARHTNGPAR